MVTCTLHNRTYKYITKHYKDKIYNYYTCSGCSSIKEELLNNMAKGYECDRIYITRYDDYLKVVLKIK